MNRGRTAIGSPSWLALLILTAGSALAPGRTEPPTLPEYQVKAGFIYNFALMTRWPKHVLPDALNLNFCIYGTDPFGDARALFADKRIGAHALDVHIVTDMAELTACHILFIPVAAGAPEPVLARTWGEPVLTVTESAGAAERGAVINLVREGEHVRFEINVDAARRARLELSSRLLNLARIVHDGSDKP